MTLSVRLSNEEAHMFKHYAESKNVSVSELIRNAVREQIENEYDLNLYNEALKEYQQNPVTYTLSEVEKELGLI